MTETTLPALLQIAEALLPLSAVAFDEHVAPAFAVALLFLSAVALAVPPDLAVEFEELPALAFAVADEP